MRVGCDLLSTCDRYIVGGNDFARRHLISKGIPMIRQNILLKGIQLLAFPGLVGLLQTAVAVFTLTPTFSAVAAGGQCAWEGGPGAPLHAYCKNEDCIEDGGLMICTEPEFYNPWGPSDADGWGYSFQDCSGWGPWTNVWPANTAAEEGEALGHIETFSGIILNCSGSQTGDTGWGYTGVGADCTEHQYQQVYNYGKLTSEARELIYEGQAGDPLAGTCVDTGFSVPLQRDRDIRCPHNTMSRVRSDGTLQCYQPSACSTAGNPTCTVTGAKKEEETDYLSGGDNPLELKRYYNSKGFFVPVGGNSRASRFNDHWRNTYDRDVTAISGNTHTQAVLRRQNGTFVYFDTAGDSILNYGAAIEASITFQTGVGWAVTYGNGDIERYDVNGALTELETRGGQVTTIVRDSGGFIQTVTDHWGKTLTFSYDSDGRLATVTDPAGGVITYTYDIYDQLTSVTYPDQAVRTYHYEAGGAHWLTGITDENGARYSTYTYNQDGQVTVSEHAGGAERYEFAYYNYSNGNQIAAITDPNGLSRQRTAKLESGAYRVTNEDMACADCSDYNGRTFDANGNPATSTNKRAFKTNYVYDQTRNLETSRTGPVSSSGATLPETRTVTTTWHSTLRFPDVITEPGRTTDHDYDTDGNLTQKKITDTASSATRIWTYTYNSVGQRLTEDGPRTDVTDVTTYTYYSCSTGDECGQLASVANALGHVTTYDSYDAHGRPTQVTDPNGVVTQIAYNSRGQVISQTVDGTETTTWTYDDAQQVTRVTQPDGGYLDYAYDDAHRLTTITSHDGERTEYTLNAAGERTREDVYDAGSNLIRTRSWEYNNQGWMTKEIGADGGEWEYAYDNNGNRTSVTDPLDRVTTYAYDGLDRLVSVTDAATGVTQYVYDDQDNLTGVTDPRSNTTSYAFNGLGDLTQLTSPDTGVTTFTQNSAGQITARTDARLLTGNVTYDALGRITQAVYPDQTITYTYDTGSNQKGRLRTLSDISGTTTWDYDNQGRVTQKQQVTNGVTRTVGYGYDSTTGLMTSMTTPSGQTIGYQYTNGDITGVTVNGATLISNVQIEAFGGIGGWTWGNGTQTTRAFDDDGRITSIAGSYAANLTWDSANRITVIAYPNDPTLDRAFSYDQLDRLILSEPPGSSSTPTLTASTTSANAGDTVTVTLAGASTTNGGHWLAFAPAGQTHTAYYDWTAVAPGVGGTTWDVTIPEYGGSYEFRLFEYDTFDELTTSATVTVGTPATPSQPTLVTPVTFAAPGDTITARLTAGTGTSSDWLALGDVGTSSYSTWTYVGAVTTKDWTVTVPTTSTDQEFRLYLNGGYTLETTSNSIEVRTKPAFYDSSLSLEPTETSVLPGSSVTAQLRNRTTGGGSDILALASASAPPDSFTNYTWVGSSVVDTDWTVNMPSTTGDYEFRLLDISYNLIIAGPVVEVTNTPAGSGGPGYTYDAVGNRLSAYDANGNGTDYTYAAGSNRLTSTSGDISRTYTYDAMGNATAWGGVTATYNAAGRMVSATNAGVTREYFHNALGQRVRKKLDSTNSVYFVYDEMGHLIGEYDTNGDLIQETVWLGDIPIATLRPKSGGGIEIYYVHTDHLNTPRMVTQSSDNAVRWTWGGEEFGADAPNEDPSSLGAFAYEMRFPGQYYDDETGLHYNYFRMYDSAMGRYTRSDPLLEPNDFFTDEVANLVPVLALWPEWLHPYVYVVSQPMVEVDIRGLGPLSMIKCIWRDKKMTKYNDECRDECGNDLMQNIRFMQAYQAVSVSEALLVCTCVRADADGEGDLCAKWLTDCMGIGSGPVPRPR